MKNLKDVKTTSLGVILIMLSIYTFLYKDINDYIEGGIFLCGIAFLFFPDDFLSILQKFLKRKSDQL